MIFLCLFFQRAADPSKEWVSWLSAVVLRDCLTAASSSGIFIAAQNIIYLELQQQAISVTIILPKHTLVQDLPKGFSRYVYMKTTLFSAIKANVSKLLYVHGLIYRILMFTEYKCFIDLQEEARQVRKYIRMMFTLIKSQRVA